MSTTPIQRILDEVGALAFPGIYDTLSARICEQAGFPMGFISGYSVSATAIGEPDLGLLTPTQMIDRGRTPVLARQKLIELGYQLILYPLAGLYAAAQAMTEVFQKLRQDGTTSGCEDRIMPFDQFNQLIGVAAKYALAERYEKPIGEGRTG
jgi:2-methylisocitrate lyase-like PEP mutase family enzyme